MQMVNSAVASVVIAILAGCSMMLATEPHAEPMCTAILGLRG